MTTDKAITDKATIDKIPADRTTTKDALIKILGRPPLAGQHLLLTATEKSMMELQRDSDYEYFERGLLALQEILEKGLDK